MGVPRVSIVTTTIIVVLSPFQNISKNELKKLIYLIKELY
jgi:hypothetical protein